MDVSITAVTRNRGFSKSLIRVAKRIDTLRTIAEDIDSADEPFDTLQLVFADRADDYIELVGTKGGDRLFQVKVGIPTNISLKRDGDEDLIKEVAKRLKEAVKLCPLAEEKKRIIMKRITEPFGVTIASQVGR